MNLVPTPEQQAIIDHPLQPLRVTAGAGTGKTTTMALRLAGLLRREALAPEEALGITFTNKAAEELADRIRLELGDELDPARVVEVTTYHGFAHGVLREFGAAVGVEREALVITPGYARQLLRDALGAGEYEHIDLTAPGRRVDEMSILAGSLGDHLVGPDDLAHGDAGDEVAAARAELGQALLRYEKVKRRIGAVDYADMIVRAYQLVAGRPDLAERIRARYRVVLLDEYQDTNPAQRELLRVLFGDGFPVTAVGDPDQTIYEWRGASLQNFRDFPSHFPDEGGAAAPTLTLTLNRRSGSRILDLANSVRRCVDDGPATAARDLRPVAGAGAGEVHHAWLRTALDEAAWLASEVRRLHDEEGVEWRDMAVLFRKNAHISAVRDALELEEVPVEVAALGGLLGIPEVADLHAWLRLLEHPEDAPALARILLGSRYRLGLGDLASLADWVRRHGRPRRDDDESLPEWTLLEAALAPEQPPGLSDEAAQRLAGFRILYVSLLREAQGVTLVELCRRILDRTGAWAEIEAMDDAARLSARLNLYRFLDLAEEWSPLEGRPSLAAFLDYLELLTEDRANDELDTARLGGENAVALLTVHRAKGLEWPVVFLPALAEGVFPSRLQARDDPLARAWVLPISLRLDRDDFLAVPAAGKDRDAWFRERHFAQEWRTAYVAVTRAKRRLYCSGAYWFSEKQPKRRSPLYELAAELPGATAGPVIDDPGDSPGLLRIDRDLEGAPDPHFPGGWRQALRLAADPGWAPQRATERGIGPAYHARMEQLEIMLGDLPVPPGTGDEPEAFRSSVTGLVTYASCPLRFQWSEVDRLPRRPSPAARRGSELHRRIELHNRGAVPLDEVDDGFYDAPAAGDAGPNSVDDGFAAFKESRFAAKRPLLVEAPFDLKVGEGRIRGRIDAVYGDDEHWEIVDFKSGRPSADPTRVVQLQAYALAARDVGFTGTAPARLTVTFAYFGDGLEEVSEEVDDSWMERAGNDLAVLVGRAAAGEYPASPSPACRHCDFLRYCEAGRSFLEAET